MRTAVTGFRSHGEPVDKYIKHQGRPAIAAADGLRMKLWQTHNVHLSHAFHLHGKKKTEKRREKPSTPSKDEVATVSLASISDESFQRPTGKFPPANSIQLEKETTAVDNPLFPWTAIHSATRRKWSNRILATDPNGSGRERERENICCSLEAGFGAIWHQRLSFLTSVLVYYA